MSSISVYSALDETVPNKKPTKKFIAVIIPLILIAGLTFAYTQRTYFLGITGETYGQAKARCGTNPVIGIDGDAETDAKYYLAPSDVDHSFTSRYDTASATDSKYKNAKFFCSVKDANAHDYTVHDCCGLINSSNKFPN